MCQAFSCLVLPDTSVVWRFGMDSHEDLIKLAKLKDDTTNPKKMEFCRAELAPKNDNYLAPDEWQLRIDQKLPAWWTPNHAEAAEKAHGEWMKELNKILIKKPIVHPFRDIKPPRKITKKHLDLLKAWVSVRDSAWASIKDSMKDRAGDDVGDSVRYSIWVSVRVSVEDSVWASVGTSVWASVEDSVRNNAWASVRDSMGDGVGDSVWAYVGSFFNLPRSAWKYTEKIEVTGYPFQSAVDLWMMGLVSSFDGETWRLHGGKNGKVLWKGNKDVLLNKEK